MAKSRSYRKRKSGSRKGSRKYKSRGRKSHKKSKSRKSRGKSRCRKYKSRKSKSRRSKKSKSRKGSRKSKSRGKRRIRKTHKKSPCKGLSQYDCNINPNCDYTTNKKGKSFCKARAGTLYKRKLSDRLNVFAGPMGRASSYSNPAGYGEGVTLDNYGPSMRLRRRN